MAKCIIRNSPNNKPSLSPAFFCSSFSKSIQTFSCAIIERDGITCIFLVVFVLWPVDLVERNIINSILWIEICRVWRIWMQRIKKGSAIVRVQHIYRVNRALNRPNEHKQTKQQPSFLSILPIVCVVGSSHLSWHNMRLAGRLREENCDAVCLYISTHIEIHAHEYVNMCRKREKRVYDGQDDVGTGSNQRNARIPKRHAPFSYSAVVVNSNNKVYKEKKSFRYTMRKER